jgi:hypothetical protein
MPTRLLSYLLALLVLPLGTGAETPAAQEPTLDDCKVGPITRTYGSTLWLVYACSDGKSVAAVAPSNSPAAPFYFMIYPRDGAYELVGEGTGPKSVTDAAYDELAQVMEQDIVDLIAAAKKQATEGGSQ